MAPQAEPAAGPIGDRMDHVQLTLWPFRQRPHPSGRGGGNDGQSAPDSSFGESKFSDSRLDPLQAGLDFFPGSAPARRQPARSGAEPSTPAPGKTRAAPRPPR